MGRDLVKMYISAISAYLDPMSEMPVTKARARLADVVDEARIAHEPIFLTRRGRRVAAVIGAEELEDLIEAAEDLEDIRAAAAARAELVAIGADPIPWEDVKVDLGLT